MAGFLIFGITKATDLSCDRLQIDWNLKQLLALFSISWKLKMGFDAKLD